MMVNVIKKGKLTEWHSISHTKSKISAQLNLTLAITAKEIR